jgi:hypothetical protein
MTESERIEQAIRAGCGDQYPYCNFPTCGCTAVPQEIVVAIRAYLVALGYGLYSLAEFDAAAASLDDEKPSTP